jgi:hypothetical protein
MHPELQRLHDFLRANPALRASIRAADGRTLLYAGRFRISMYREILRDRATRPELADKQILADVLATVSGGTAHATMLAWVSAIEPQLPPVDADRMWRLLSAIFVGNARGAVSFLIGGDISAAKIFANNEVPVLLQNPNITQESKDMLAYYQRAILAGTAAINTGFIAA